MNDLGLIISDYYYFNFFYILYNDKSKIRKKIKYKFLYIIIINNKKYRLIMFYNKINNYIKKLKF